MSDWWPKTRFSDFSHLLIAEPTDQLPPAEDLRARGLSRPDGGDHGGLLLAPWAFPLQWDPLLQCAGGLVGPLWDAQLPGAAVPAAAGGLQALPRLGGYKCQSGLLEEGRGFLLKYFYSTLFSTWKLIKYFLCAWCNNVFLSSFQAPWKGSTKIKLGIMQIFLQVSARKVMWSCSKEDRLRTECLVPQPLKSFSWSTSCLTFLCLSFLICKTWCNDTLHFLSLWGWIK